MKTCKAEGCNNRIWSNGLCKNHITKKPLKCMKNQSLTTKKKVNDGNIIQMRDFFMDVWKSKSHNCENCGKRLGNEPLSYMFDHLLEKSKYPDLKYEKENICLMCLECHDLKTRGFITDLIREKIDYVKNKFLK